MASISAERMRRRTARGCRERPQPYKTAAQSCSFLLMGDGPPLVRMREIRKRFGGVEVLCGVQLDAFGGEVHILAGENGAGKSTLIKILGGVHTRFEGSIELAGKPFQPRSPLHAN